MSCERVRHEHVEDATVYCGFIPVFLVFSAVGLDYQVIVQQEKSVHRGNGQLSVKRDDAQSHVIHAKAQQPVQLTQHHLSRAGW
jgi:hypothetical protein